MNSFQVADLCAGYGSNTVLHSVNFSLVPGTVTAITGLNGSGKSTLLKCMANLITPFSGNCLLDSVPVKDIKPSKLARRIAFCAQMHPDCGYLTVRELVEMGRFSFRESKPATRHAAEYAMNLTGVSGFADRKMHELSGGICQRVWLSLALAQQPELLLLDEPSNFLDPAGKYALAELLRNLKNKENITIVLVTHDLELVIRSSDFVIALKDGKLVKSGETHNTLDVNAIKEIYGINYQPLIIN